jgi:methionyl-tRNA formyltransferase
MIERYLRVAWAPTPQAGTPSVFPRRPPGASQLPVPAAGDLEQTYDHIRAVDAPGYPPAFDVVGGLRYSYRRAVYYGDRIETDCTITKEEEGASSEEARVGRGGASG